MNLPGFLPTLEITAYNGRGPDQLSGSGLLFWLIDLTE